MASNTDLKINDVTMPSLKLNGLTIKKEKIWSSNTGRAANGEMIGDIIGVKHTLSCEWPPLTRENVTAIDAAISPAFFNVTFLDPATNAAKTIRCYAGSPVYPVYSYKAGVKTYSGVAVDLIEK
jgi:hypothetical protein